MRKRNWICWLLVLCMTIALTGCASGGGDETAPSETGEIIQATGATESTVGETAKATVPEGVQGEDVTAPGVDMEGSDTSDATQQSEAATSGNNGTGSNTGSGNSGSTNSSSSTNAGSSTSSGTSGNTGSNTSSGSSSTSGNAPAATTPPATTPPATTHTHSYSITVVAATCTEGGYTLHKCSCGDSYKDTYTNALGHSWGNWVTTKEATTSAEGQQTRTCTRCGATETQTIAKLAEVIDIAALEAYGRSYGASTYGWVPYIGVRAGYFPGCTVYISTMSEGYREVAECVDATTSQILVYEDVTGGYLDVEVVHESGNWYVVWVYYG